MAVTVGAVHLWTLSCKPTGLPNMPSDAPVPIPGTFSEDIEDLVPVGTVMQVFLGSIDQTKVVSFVLHSSVNDVSVYTNANTALTADQVFPLGTAKAVGWNTSMSGVPTPLTGPITALYVDNTTGAKDTVFRASFLLKLP